MTVYFRSAHGMATVRACEPQRELLAARFDRAFPNLDPYEMADDFISIAAQHGADAHGYAVEQTQSDGSTSVATLRVRDAR